MTGTSGSILRLVAGYILLAISVYALYITLPKVARENSLVSVVGVLVPIPFLAFAFWLLAGVFPKAPNARNR
jgi:hypothetical protein